MADFTSLRVDQIAAMVQRGEVSAEQVTLASLDAIRAKHDLGAYITVCEKEALEQARLVDNKRANGETLGVLAGVPIGIKDALCTRDVATTCASKILVHGDHKYTPPYDATVVARLRAADAIFPGKCNMDEFAMGSSTENSAFFVARNPADPSRTPGGSSGGSAVTVAAKMTPASLGSDTGGSIRQPAAYTGCVGIKPTYGRVSRYGLIAFASSLDQVGPFASDVRGAARVLEVIAGGDQHDATTLNAGVDSYEQYCGRGVQKGLRIGVPSEYFADGLDPAVRESVQRVIASLAKEGAEIIDVHLPHTEYAIATYYIVATAEASSNLARFDGVRFGLRVEPPRADLREMYESTRQSGFGREVQRRILLGTYVLSAGYYDAYYLKAQKVRTLIRQDFDAAFSRCDVLIAPTAPTPAFKLGEQIADPLTMYLNDVYTLPASLAGIPAISVPSYPTRAISDRPALPVGVQLIGPSLSESRLVQLADAVFEFCNAN